MRDVQNFGRYVLYGVIAVLLLSGMQSNPPLMAFTLAAMLVGPPAYWLWTRKVHLEQHLDSPKLTCRHCQVRLDFQRQQEEVARMAQLNRKYRHGS